MNRRRRGLLFSPKMKVQSMLTSKLSADYGKTCFVPTLCFKRHQHLMNKVSRIAKELSQNNIGKYSGFYIITCWPAGAVRRTYKLC